MRLFSKALERLARENPELYSKIETVDVIPRVSSFRYEFSWMEGIADTVKSKLQEIMGTNGFPHFDLELMMGFKFKKNANLTKEDIQNMMDFISRNMQRSEEMEKAQPFKVRKSDFKNIRNKDLRSPDIRINLNRLNTIPSGYKRAKLNKVKVTDNVLVTSLTKQRNDRLIILLKESFGRNVDVVDIAINDGLYDYIG